MADMRIESVIINPGQTWQGVEKFINWQVIRSTGITWGGINQIVQTNQSVLIEVEVIISSWERIKTDLSSWQAIKNTMLSWSALRSW